MSILVLAGNYDIFKRSDFITTGQCRYISTPYHMYGYQHCNILLLYGWNQQAEDEIINNLQTLVVCAGCHIVGDIRYIATFQYNLFKSWEQRAHVSYFKLSRKILTRSELLDI